MVATSIAGAPGLAAKLPSHSPSLSEGKVWEAGAADGSFGLGLALKCFFSSLGERHVPMVLTIANDFKLLQLSSILLCVADNLTAGIQGNKKNQPPTKQNNADLLYMGRRERAK